MQEPTRVTIYDSNDKEIKVALHAGDRTVCININGKEITLPANWALSLANCITISAKQSIEDAPNLCNFHPMEICPRRIGDCEPCQFKEKWVSKNG